MGYDAIRARQRDQVVPFQRTANKMASALQTAFVSGATTPEEIRHRGLVVLVELAENTGVDNRVRALCASAMASIGSREITEARKLAQEARLHQPSRLEALSDDDLDALLETVRQQRAALPAPDALPSSAPLSPAEPR